MTFPSVVRVSVGALSDGRSVTVGELPPSRWRTHRVYAKQTESHLCTLMISGI